jgi:hypothetical protein
MSTIRECVYSLRASHVALYVLLGLSGCSEKPNQTQLAQSVDGADTLYSCYGACLISGTVVGSATGDVCSSTTPDTNTLLQAHWTHVEQCINAGGAIDGPYCEAQGPCDTDGSAGSDSGSGSDEGPGPGSGSGCGGGYGHEGDYCECDAACESGKCDRFNTCRNCDGIYDYTTIDGYRANKPAYVAPGTWAPWLPVHSTMLLIVRDGHWYEEWNAEVDECQWKSQPPTLRCPQFLNHGTNALTPARKLEGSCAYAGSPCELGAATPAGCTCERIPAGAGENDGDPRNACPGAEPQFRYGLSVSSIGDWYGTREDADRLLTKIDGCDCEGITPFLSDSYARTCITNALACLAATTDAELAEGYACMQQAAMSGSGADTSGCSSSCNWYEAAQQAYACIANTHVCNDDESLREEVFLNGSCPADRTAACSGPDIFGYWP